MSGCTGEIRLLVHHPGPALVVLAPELVKKIRSLLSPLGLRLEEGRGTFFVAGEKESEVMRVSSALSTALSGAVEGRRDTVVLLEDADLSEVEETLAGVQRVREQAARWRQAGLPTRFPSDRRNWDRMLEILLFIEEVPLPEERFVRLLRRAEELHAEALARDLQAT